MPSGCQEQERWKPVTVAIRYRYRYPLRPWTLVVIIIAAHCQRISALNGLFACLVLIALLMGMPGVPRNARESLVKCTDMVCGVGAVCCCLGTVVTYLLFTNWVAMTTTHVSLIGIQCCIDIWHRNAVLIASVGWDFSESGADATALSEDVRREWGPGALRLMQLVRLRHARYQLCALQEPGQHVVAPHCRVPCLIIDARHEQLELLQ